MSQPPQDADTVPYIAHDEFRAGLAHGRFRLVVNPELARRYVVQRTRMNLLAVLVIGSGAVLALSGQSWFGAALVAVGVVTRRLVRRKAAKILLHLALRDPAVYAETTTQGVMEVRRSD
jgi:hypothetical protein